MRRDAARQPPTIILKIKEIKEIKEILNLFLTPFCKKSINSEAGFEFSEKFHVDWSKNIMFHQ